MYSKRIHVNSCRRVTPRRGTPPRAVGEHGGVARRQDPPPATILYKLLTAR